MCQSKSYHCASAAQGTYIRLLRQNRSFKEIAPIQVKETHTYPKETYIHAKETYKSAIETIKRHGHQGPTFVSFAKIGLFKEMCVMRWLRLVDSLKT